MIDETEDMIRFFYDCTPEQLREKFISTCVSEIKKIRAAEENEYDRILLLGDPAVHQKLGILYATEPDVVPREMLDGRGCPKPDWSKDGF